MFTSQEAEQLKSELITALIDGARQLPDRRLPIRDQTGRVVATVDAHDAATRPKDMPRHLRPKRKLSKRQRIAARRDKLAAA
ncbi:MAG: hypothetical protein ACRDLV_12605 [Solirubrobacteraceae bacterium]